MKLTRLKGNTLKVYLTLIDERESGDRCPLSQRMLSRTARGPRKSRPLYLLIISSPSPLTIPTPFLRL